MASSSARVAALGWRTVGMATATSWAGAWWRIGTVRRSASGAIDGGRSATPRPAATMRVSSRTSSTSDELTEDGLVLRYRTDETDDGLPSAEGAFTTCSFWMVSALVAIGELRRGRALCERLLSHASELGLYAEEIAPRSGRHLGNFPQALTHLALIHAVTSVIRAERGLHTSVLTTATGLSRPTRT
jgi:GH15 family glucan-1,4-alpha-glucosidase